MLKVISGILKKLLETISDGNTFRGIIESYHFEPCASDFDKEGRSVREGENTGHMITSALVGFDLPFN